MCNLTDPIYHDADKAREHLEALRWPDGPVCPHCGSVDNAYALKGKSTRPGVYKCADCRKPFSVTVGTVFERSKVPLNKWILAAHLMASSKKGFSAHQLHRTVGVTYKTAWFMMHRLREAMRDDSTDQMGGPGSSGIVEADETYIGNKKGAQKRAGVGHKMTVFSLVERGGKVRSAHLSGKKFDGIKEGLKKNVSPEAHVVTDQYRAYNHVGKVFAKHTAINHGANEWARGEAHTNTIEGFFSVFKRGMKGVYQHCREDHLHRYLAEFDFRYNHRAKLGVSDVERAQALLVGIGGKRLTYRQPLGPYFG